MPRLLSAQEALERFSQVLRDSPVTIQLDGTRDAVQAFLKEAAALGKRLGFLVASEDLDEVHRHIEPVPMRETPESTIRAWLRRGSENAKLVGALKTRQQSNLRSPTLILLDATAYEEHEAIADLKVRIREIHQYQRELDVWMVFACQSDRAYGPNVASTVESDWWEIR